MPLRFDPPPTVPRPEGRCFLVLCKDGPEAPRLREEHLRGHLDHVERHWRAYVTAGPLRRPGEDAITGSLFVIRAGTIEEAKALMEKDPYIARGLYRSVDYDELTPAIGLFPGGKIWEDPAALAGRAEGHQQDPSA